MTGEPLRINGYLAFAIGICLTAWTCMLVVGAQDAQIRASFVRDTDKVAADTSARLRTYFDTLLSLQALFAVKGEVDRAEFGQFVRELRLAGRYPGFRALQFVRYVPADGVAAFSAAVRRQSSDLAPPFIVHPPPPAGLRNDRADHYIIDFNEPMLGNENAFGLDLAALPAQLAAVLEARDSGRIVATGRTMLVQDSAAHPGFVARAPVYRQHMPTATIEQRRAAFIGVVAIVFRVDDLLAEVVDPQLLRHLTLQVLDSGAVGQAALRNDDGAGLLFDSGGGARVAATRVLENHVDVAQRRWQLRYSALAGSRYGRAIAPPLLVGLGGLVISALIAALLLASQRGARLEQRLRASLDEKQASLVELEQQKKHVELAQANLITSEKLAALGALVAGIAHELNTPIGNSLLTATALADMVVSFEKQYTSGGLRRSALEAHLADTRLACTIIASSLSRAAELITSFKQVSVDQTSDQRRRFDLAEVVRDTVATYAAQLRRANCQVTVAIAAGLMLDSYPGGLGQVLSNLINNALLHAFGAVVAGAAPSHIVINASAIDGSDVLLHFSDDGVGMNDNTLHQIFDPFFSTKLGQGGSGLGMHIVYNVVTGMLGGTIHVESAPGQGTRVVLTLPTVAPTVAQSPDRALA
ncbi:CHASE domain-containing protein [Massilia sp. PWRC2]|uniref:CHASE domain-containing protein n=1 Tax=Massilia sp. PWRC2 TaxID=2804626 RepID=UPI003CED4B8E